MTANVPQEKWEGVSPKQAAFLSAYAEIGIIKDAARAAGITPRTVRRWREEAKFADVWKEAEELAIQSLEAEAVRRAQHGLRKYKFHSKSGAPFRHPETGEPYYEHEYSDTLLIFMLKAKRPEVYKERSHFEHSGEGITVIIKEATKPDADD